MKNILFTICGRAGSKGVKNKNVLDFCGYPLVDYTLAIIRMFREKHQDEYARIDVALSTDSPQLREQAERRLPALFSIDRDAALAGDMVRKIDVIRDAARRAAAFFQVDYDAVIDLDLTSPLRTMDDLENVIQKRWQSDADVVYTVTEGRRNPYFNQVTRYDDGYFFTVCGVQLISRQQAKKVYDMNGSIYAYSPSFIASEEAVFRHAHIVEMRDTGILDIDGPEDYELMQVIADYLYEHYAEYGAIRKEVMLQAEKKRFSATELNC